MKAGRLSLPLAASLGLTLLLGHASGQAESWESLTDAGLAAHRQGDYAAADKRLNEALAAAETTPA